MPLLPMGKQREKQMNVQPLMDDVSSSRMQRRLPSDITNTLAWCHIQRKTEDETIVELLARSVAAS
jgi:hypothetical protein